MYTKSCRKPYTQIETNTTIQDICKTLHKPCTNTEKKLTQNPFAELIEKHGTKNFHNTLYKILYITHTQPIHNPCSCAPGLGPNPGPLALVRVLDLVVALALILTPVLALVSASIYAFPMGMVLN